MTGWRITDDQGNEYKSYMAAAIAMRARPEATFVESSLDMSGRHEAPCTEKIAEFMRGYVVSKQGGKG